MCGGSFSLPREVADIRYSTIVADPPWDYGEVSCNRSSTGTGAAVAHYPTMTLEEITALPVVQFADDQAHLYLWVTNSFLRHGFDIVKAWGFEPKSVLTWVKTYDKEIQPSWMLQEGGECAASFPITEPRARVGLGRWYLNATEHIIFGVRGRTPLLAKLPNVIFAPVVGHSVKPEQSYALVERCSPGPYLEMFARRPRHGWHVWGNEVDSDIAL